MSLAPAHYRQLGNLDLYLSPLGLGTVKLGRNTQVKYPTTFALPDDEAVANLLAVARDSGINLIDTAPAYGSSESRLGRLLPGRRSDWVICTKVGESYVGGKSLYDFSANATAQSLATSLRQLNTDYLDIVLIHCSDDDLNDLAQSEALAELQRWQQQGHIRAVGASTKSLAAGLLAAETTDVVMVSYSPDDLSQAAVLERAAALHKGILLKKVLGSGHSQDQAGAIRQAMTAPAVTSAIIGTLNPAHLQANVIAALNALQA